VGLANHGGQVEPGERHLEHSIDPVLRVLANGILRHGEHDDGHLWVGLAQRLGDLHAAHPALQQRVDDDHVRLVLAHGRHRLVTGRYHLEHLDLRLRLQQRAHVRRDLRHVLDHQEANLLD